MNKLNYQEPQEKYPVNPKMFNLWLSILGMIMLFVGLSSGYIVRRAEGNWLQFEMPSDFQLSTILVVLSSITMFWAFYAAKKDELNQIKAALISTFILGFAFCLSQIQAWENLMNSGLFFAGSEASSSWLYVITATHFVHIIGGLIALLIAIIQAFRLNIHKKNMLRISLINTYWHFVGILWIYLYLFLFLNR